MPKQTVKNRKQQRDLTLVVQKNVKAIRQARVMTQQELANAAGFKVQAISRIENSPQNISLKNLQKLATALNCEASDLVSSDLKKNAFYVKLSRETRFFKQFVRDVKSGKIKIQP